MNIIVNYSEILSKLDYITSIVEDSSVDNKMKNIIFSITNDKVHLIGFNSLYAVCKVELNDSKVYGLEKDIEYVQIHVTDFNKLLKSLALSRRTKIKEINLDKKEGYFTLTAHEEAISEDLDYASELDQIISWKFDIIPITEKVVKSISVSSEKLNMESILCKDIRLYIDNLLPIISAEDSKDESGKIYFGEEFVYVIPKSSAILLVNTLKDDFKNISLTNKSLKFLNRLLVNNDVVEVAKTEIYLIIKFEGVESFINYRAVVKPIDNFMNKISKTNELGEIMSYKTVSENTENRLAFVNKKNGVILEKIYFQDVLKRVQWLDDILILKFNLITSKVELSNRKFKQNIPILKIKGMSEFGEVKFSIPPAVLSSLLIGDDDLFSNTMFMFLVQIGNGYALINTDGTGSWLSIIQTK